MTLAQARIQYTDGRLLELRAVSSASAVKEVDTTQGIRTVISLEFYYA